MTDVFTELQDSFFFIQNKTLQTLMIQFHINQFSGLYLVFNNVIDKNNKNFRIEIGFGLWEKHIDHPFIHFFVQIMLY